MFKRISPALLAGIVGVLAVSFAPATASSGTDTTSTTSTTTAPAVDDTDTEGRAGIDPRKYFDEYPETVDATYIPLTTTTGAVPRSPNVRSADVATDAAPQYEVPPPQPSGGDVPGIDEDNTFVDAGESTFVSVDDDRESTFGLDVDTGSFNVAQTFLAQGMAPPADSIRPEEWINAFDYGDVYDNEAGDVLDLDVETAAAPLTNDGTQLVRIAMHAEDITDEERPPAHLTFVIDTSGSMDIRERLGLVQSSLALLVQNLRDDDTIAIVTYGDQASALLPATPVAEWESIVEAIDQLGPSGSTNMEAGLLLGYDQARDAFVEGDINAVLLASDGVANVGTTDSTQLVDRIAEEGADGINLVTVGYGMGNYNDVLMEQLANQGDGFYSYVDTYEEAVRLFVEDLNSTLTPVAMEAKSQVVFDDEVVSEYRLIGYENRELDDSDFRDDTVDAGEVGAGHTVTALYEVRLRDDAQVGVEWGEARLRWTPVGGGDAVEVSVPILPADPETDGTEALRLSALVATTAELAKESTVVTERGVTYDDIAEAAAELDEAGVDGADDLLDVVTLLQNV